MMNQLIKDYEGILDIPLNDVRLIGSIVLVVILFLAVVGMAWVTRVQMLLLLVLVVAQGDLVIGSFIVKDEEKPHGLVGYNATVFMENLYSNYHDYKEPDKVPTFFSVFGVFFPAVTGIVAGANLSGDLRNPETAIPKGTLLAILTTFMTYIIHGLVIGGVSVQNASGNVTEYNAWQFGYNSKQHGYISEDVPLFNDCGTREFERTCEFGSANDQQNMAKISLTGYLIFAGCFAATLSSAIASLSGAPRVLQALAKDKLYPGIGYFATGYGPNNEPIRGYILTSIVSLTCIMIANLDIVSSLLSNIFVCTYALVNFSVFHASIAKSPGWRPSFRYYNPWLSLAASFLCLVVMFLMEWITALITLIVVAFLYCYIGYRKPDANWGSSDQAQQFVLALRTVQSLNEVPDHVKNYRPKLLVFSGNPSERKELIEFGSMIVKKHSFMICTNIVKEDKTSSSGVSVFETEGIDWFKQQNIKAFFSVTEAKTFSDGAKHCINLIGLGKLRPNMVLIGFKADWQDDIEGLEHYINAINYSLDMKVSISILRVAKNDKCNEENVGGNDVKPVVEEAESVTNDQIDKYEVISEHKTDPSKNGTGRGTY